MSSSRECPLGPGICGEVDPASGNVVPCLRADEVNGQDAYGSRLSAKERAAYADRIRASIGRCLHPDLVEQALNNLTAPAAATDSDQP